jgi:hypothetical protein
MSIIDSAKAELKAANFGDEDSRVMIGILEQFFDQWDSGGAVSVAAPVLQRLIAGKPITPLTGAEDEWIEVGPAVFQNRRCCSVFKDPRFHDGQLAYDIDAADPRAAIAFPYWPDRADMPSPVVEFAVPTQSAT